MDATGALTLIVCKECGKSGSGLYSAYNRYSDSYNTYCEFCKEIALPPVEKDSDEVGVRCNQCEDILTRAVGWYHSMESYKDKCKRCFSGSPNFTKYKKIESLEDLGEHIYGYQFGAPQISGNCNLCSGLLRMSRGWFHQAGSECLPLSQHKNYKAINKPEDFGNDSVENYYILADSDSDDSSNKK